MSNAEKRIIQEVAQGLYPLIGAHLMTSGKLLKFDIDDITSTNSVSIMAVELGPGPNTVIHSASTRITYEMIKKNPELNEMVLTGLIRDMIGLDAYDTLLKIVDENADRITKSKVTI